MEQWTTKRIVFLTLTVGIVLYLVYYVPGVVGHFLGRMWDVVVVLVLATALAVLLGPPVRLMCRLRIPLPDRGKRALATLLVLVITVWALWVLVSLTATQLFQEVERLALIVQTWLKEAPNLVERWLAAYSDRLPPGIEEQATGYIGQATQGLLKYQFGFAKGALLSGWYLVELCVVPVLAFYFLTDGAALRKGAVAFLPAKRRVFVNTVLDDVGVLLDRYVQTLVALCIIKAVLVGGTLYLCGVNMYITLGIMAGVLRLAPVVGPLIAALPCVGIPMLQNGMHTGLIVLLFYSIYILIDGKLVTPLMLGSCATLHPVVAIVSLLIGYEFLGVLGLLIAIPAAGTIRAVFLRYQEQFGEQAEEQLEPVG